MRVICALLALTVAIGFNACSGVNFSTSSDNGTNSPQCMDGDICVPPPPTYTNYDETHLVPTAYNKVDILIVLDNSGSMDPDLTKLGERLDGLVEILDQGSIDWNMCFTLTDVQPGDGRSLAGTIQEWRRPASGGGSTSTGLRVLNNTVTDRATIFAHTFSRIAGDESGNEEALTVIRNAVQNSGNASCFRNDSALATIIISDEDQKSCGGRCENWQSSEVPTAAQVRNASEYRTQFRALDPATDDPRRLIDDIRDRLGERSFINHSIVIRPNDVACYVAQDATNPAFFGKIYTQLQAQSGGILGDICASSYSDQLRAMGQRTAETINSVTLQCAPSQTPTVTATPALSAGVTWSVVGNKIIFSAPVQPGTSVRVQYVCQN